MATHPYRKDKGRPRYMTAQQVADALARDQERDDEFGTAKELKREARRALRAHGHTPGQFTFHGSRRWSAWCTTCWTTLISIDVRDDAPCCWSPSRPMPRCPGGETSR
mgnify:CR=1 FL=1|jgi:hypothetical protein